MEYPYTPPTPVNVNSDTVQKVRKVILEEFTGHTCGNCPTAAKSATGLKNIHGDKLVLLTIHEGFFALPQAPPFTYDFRTATGTAYGSFFGVIQHPMALVNRIDYPANNHLKTPGNWSSLIDSLLDVPVEAFISMENDFNEATKILDCNIRIDVLRPLTGTFNLVVLLMEDSIQKAQIDYDVPNDTVQDYWHRHILRANITGAWGDSVLTDPQEGDTLLKNYSYSVPADFKGYPVHTDQCFVIAYLYDATPPAPTYRILQAEETKIK